VAVDLDDGVIDIEQRVPAIGVAIAGRRAARYAEQPSETGQCDQEPRGDRVELAHVSEGERSQERTQRRGRVGPGEDPAHRTVPQQRHVIDAVRARDHPAHQRGDLQPRVRTLVRRDRQMLIGEIA